MPQHAYQYCRGPLPVPPGKSGFGIKGDFYRHLSETIGTIDKKSDGALDRILAREGLKQFMAQAFLATSFYDNLPLARVTMAIAEVTGRDIFALTSKMGVSSAERCMTGVYQSLVGGLQAVSFHKHFPSVIKFFYNYAPLTVTPGADKKSAAVTRAGIPLDVAEWWSLVSVPFVKLPLEANGAKDVTVDWRVAPHTSAAGAV
ncbi:MAG TPA: hypothetical protein VGO62_01380, partial [Myxococcota bacterium]